jgi:hypothetical protein
MPPKKLHPSKCPLLSGFGIGASVGAAFVDVVFIVVVVGIVEVLVVVSVVVVIVVVGVLEVLVVGVVGDVVVEVG